MSGRAGRASTGGETRGKGRSALPRHVSDSGAARSLAQSQSQTQFALFLRSAAQSSAQSQSQSQFAFFLSSAAQSLAQSQSQSQSQFALLLRSAAQRRARLSRSRSRSSRFSCAAQRRAWLGRSRSRSSRFSCAAQRRARLSCSRSRSSKSLARRNAELGSVAFRARFDLLRVGAQNEKKRGKGAPRKRNSRCTVSECWPAGTPT
jgi:hypothetical protein